MRPPIALLGIPFDEQSSFERGSAKAPSFVRDAWRSKASNLYSEDLTLVDEKLVHDAGDVAFAHGEDPFAAIEGRLDALLAEGYAPICIGGDHSVTYPVVRSVSRVHGKLDILHFDAHPDLYDDYDGNRLSHACPFARIMEEGLAGRLVQVGVRSMTPPQRGQAERFGAGVPVLRRRRAGPRLRPRRLPPAAGRALDAAGPIGHPDVQREAGRRRHSGVQPALRRAWHDGRGLRQATQGDRCQDGSRVKGYYPGWFFGSPVL